MSDYDFRPGGSLKLKGKDGVGKKKKKSSKSLAKAEADAQQAQERQRVKDLMFKDEGEGSAGSKEGSARNSPVPGGSNSRKTDAERRFEQTQRERMAARVAKLASKTHKDRVNEFNTKLEALSEHHDIPKVGPG